jgi:hypothetical protein
MWVRVGDQFSNFKSYGSIIAQIFKCKNLGLSLKLGFHSMYTLYIPLEIV